MVQRLFIGAGLRGGQRRLRGRNAIDSLVSISLFNVLPTFIEVAMVFAILWRAFSLWFGVVALLVLFPVIINTEAGLRNTSQQLVETVRAFGATPRQIFFKVSLPSALPFIFAGFKLGIGRGLIGVVVAELFGARAGLGQLIQQSAETFNMPNLFAGVTMLAVAGIALTSGFAWLEQKLLPWRD